MVSTFGWLDTDNDQRRKMLEVVDLFKEQGTVDELGIGSIRDALAGALFPGISYVHTRLRYVLFIPWLLQRASTGGNPAEMAAQFRKLEYRLIESLLAGGEQTGVIGNRARDKLRRMPSGIYWGALGEWGIRTAEFSVEGYFRRQHDYRALASRTLRADDPEAREIMPSTGLDPHLPEAPADLLKAATFKLRSKDEQYLSDLIAAKTQGSMFAWLIHNPPQDLPDYFWEIDNLGDAPEQLRDLTDHARRFHTAIYGALLVYNLLLARKSGRDELVADLDDAIDVWRDELAASGVFEGWSRRDWWATVRRQNPRINVLTERFVNEWLNLIRVDSDVATSDRAAELVTTRERQIKGGRARLVNQGALDRWSGVSGLGRLDYRWSIAKPYLADLYAARSAS
ncbi:DUF6361 family protein [Flexivirga lutea]